MNKCLNFILIIGIIASTCPQTAEASIWSIIERAAKHIVAAVIEAIVEIIIPKDIFDEVISIYNADNNKQAAEERQKALDKSLAQISQELADLTQKIDSEFANLAKDVKLNSMLELISNQQSQIDQFMALISSSSNYTDFPVLLQKFIDNYKNLNLESRMVNLIDVQTPGTESLISAMIRAFKTEVDNQNLPIQSSPNRLIYDFYMAVYYNVYRGYYFMQTGVITKDFKMQEFFEEDHNYFRSLAAIQIGKLTNSMQKMSSMFGVNMTYQRSFIDVSNRSGHRFCTDFMNVYVGLIKAQSGYVVTGVRYKIHNNTTLYIQIQEGQLIDHGQVNTTTVEWKDPPEDISNNNIPFACNLPFRFVADKINLDDAVLTGIQIIYQNADSDFFISIYGHEYVDFNQGIMNDTIIMKSLNKTTANVISVASLFSSLDVELSVKAPLSGIEFMQFPNETTAVFYKPRLITYDAMKFINVTNIGDGIKKDMSEFTKNRLRELIGEQKKKKNGSNVWMVVLIVACVISLFVIVLLIAIKKYRERVAYTRIE